MERIMEKFMEENEEFEMLKDCAERFAKHSMVEEASSNKVMVVVPAENELVVPAPKFKRHKVSTIRDIPPGCSRVAAPNFGSSKQITVDRYSQGKW
ncbi:hypothetical protein J1N35_001759 [Gossypium stocksii]|uniref:Uncharacterized protein n=1 Tax=Gossypium stocksii TaxID=47602 RepID=A0A9D4ALN5_9ROSI|nr:hypothetical protein J1N35_001759 [Gossypium stocksii]